MDLVVLAALFFLAVLVVGAIVPKILEYLEGRRSPRCGACGSAIDIDAKFLCADCYRTTNRSPKAETIQ